MTNQSNTSMRRRLLWCGLPVLFLLFAANHAEYWIRQKAEKQREEMFRSVNVRRENTLYAGHNSIGIKETAAPEQSIPGDLLFLRFATLGEWAFDAVSPSTCPKDIQALSGREVFCVGFMRPLVAGTEFKTFCLLRTTQTCCFGPQPQYNQYLLVEMKAPVKFERLTPVIVRGKFYPDPQPKEGFIYRMEGESMMPMTEETDPDPADTAQKAGVPLFDFAPLAAMESGKSSAIPKELLALDGKPFLVAGYLLNRVEEPPPRILVGKDYWDGVARGKRPTIYSAVMVFPADASRMPPVWKEKGMLAGVLHVETNPQNWQTTGIVSLRGARTAGSAASGRRGPLIEPTYEILMLGALLGLALFAGRGHPASLRHPGSSSKPETHDKERLP